MTLGNRERSVSLTQDTKVASPCTNPPGKTKAPKDASGISNKDKFHGKGEQKSGSKGVVDLESLMMEKLDKVLARFDQTDISLKQLDRKSEDLAAKFETSHGELKLSIDAIKESLSTVDTKVNEVAARVNVIEESHEEIQTRLKRDERTNRELQGMVSDLRDENRLLHGRVLHLDVQQRAQLLELHGLYENQGEDLWLVVRRLAEKLGCPDDLKHDLNIYRIGSRNMTSRKLPRIVLVKFDSDRCVKKWIDYNKSLELKSGDVIHGGGSFAIFLNRSYPAPIKLLFAKVRKQAAASGWGKSWIMGTQVLCKIRPEEPATVIVDEDQLECLRINFPKQHATST